MKIRKLQCIHVEQFFTGVEYGAPSGETLEERIGNGLENASDNFEQIDSIINPNIPFYTGIPNTTGPAFFFQHVIIGETEGAQQDGTIPNSTYKIEAEAGEEKGWFSGTLSEIYKELNNE